jgi:hypothetical protein
MAAGTYSNMSIDQPYLATRVNELLAQQGEIFNESSRGAIRLTTVSKKGHYDVESMFSNVSGLAARRDISSVGTQNDTNLAQVEHISVKLNRKIIPIGMTHDSFRKAFGSYSQTEFTDVVAEQAANAMRVDMVDSALMGVRAALKAQAASYLTESSLGSISTQTLVNSLKKLGDRADRVVCWVMHSKPYFDLVLNQLAQTATPFAGYSIAQGTPVTLNRPVIITDSASLKTQLNSPDVDNYFTLGLVDNAVSVENTEEQEVVVQEVTGLENLVVRFQGEYAFNLGLKGFQWDTGNGGINPVSTDLGLGLGSNWDTIMTDVKNRAGVCAMTL